jgi:hypothetical protein
MTPKAATPGLLDRIDSATLHVPPGHVGPLMLSDTGRTVWWTGRVAIGLRYEPPRSKEPASLSALLLQKSLLRRSPGRASA